MNRRNLALTLLLAAQVFALAVLGALTGGDTIAWPATLLTTLVLLLATSALLLALHLARKRRGAAPLPWHTALLALAAALVAPLASLIRPRAAPGEHIALLICLLILLFSPLLSAGLPAGDTNHHA